MAAQQQRRQPGRHPRGVRLALLLCLVALCHDASAQGIFELLTGPATTPTTTTPVTTTPATTTPATTTPATTTPTTTTPATTTPATTTPATTTPTTTAPTTTPATTTPATTTPATTTPTTTAPTTTTPATTTPATTTPATTTPATDVAPTFGSLTPAAAPAAAAAVGAPQPAVATTPVAMAPGADGAAVVDTGNVDTTAAPSATDDLPPSPPEAWQALQKDCQLVFDVEIRGKYIIPFTSPKASVIERVLRDRYFRSAALPDIKVSALNPFTYLSYDAPTQSADTLPASEVGGRRRLSQSRDLLQLEKSGAELKIVLATGSVRVDSEIASFVEGVDSGSLARDFTLAGIDTENITILLMPYTEDLIGPGNTEDSNKSNSLQTWVIATIVGVILLVVPVPLYMLVRWRKRKNKEGRELQAAEAEAARARMQTKMMRPGSKSFSIKPAGGSSADIMVRSGSVGGLAGFANNGRLQSWSSPDRSGQQQYGISRQTSVTSTGSALQSARGGSFMHGMPQRVSSMHSGGVRPYASAMAPLPQPGSSSSEEELHTARTDRSQRQ